MPNGAQTVYTVINHATDKVKGVYAKNQESENKNRNCTEHDGNIR